MADENLYAFLNRRERELQHQISALKGQIEETRGHLAQREQELAQIIHFRASETIAGGAMSRLQHINDNPTASGALPPDITERFERMTIKQLVTHALLNHLKTGGNAALIRDFMRDAYRRTIEPSSLRPQLHRLKADGVLYHDPSSDLWNLTAEKRRQYSHYNHPTSEAARTELQTDEPDENVMLEIGKGGTRYIGIETFGEGPEDKNKPRPRLRDLK